jgi:uncharacterized protein
MTEQLRTRCVCGWETTGAEDEVVEATLDHGLRVHNMGGTREDVLARAERVEADPPPELEVVDVPDRHRFEARVGASTIGFTRYDVRGDALWVLHTEIDPGHEGKGYGSRLAAGVLAAARARGLRAIVTCPFVTAYVRRHRDDYPDVQLEGEGRSRPATSATPSS